MKHSLKYIAHFSVVGTSVATASETAGMEISSAWSHHLPLIVFIAALLLLTVITDYSRSLRHSFELRSAPPRLPAHEAFRSVSASASTPPRRTARVDHQLRSAWVTPVA